MEKRRVKPIQSMIAELQAGVLAGDIESRCLAEGSEGVGNRAQFDGFGTRSYNERNTILAQLSP